MNTPDVQGVRFRHPEGAAGMAQVLRLSELRQRSLNHSLYALQRRDFHVFQLVTEGHGCHHFEFGSLRLRQGDVFHVRPGQVDWFDEESRHEALLLVFMPEAIPRANIPRLRLTNPLRPRAADFARLEHLVELIGPFCGSPQTREAGLLLVQAFLSAIDAMDAAATASSPSAASTLLCERFEGLLAEHQIRSRSVAWYAAALGVTTKTLARAVRAALGDAPKQHIDKRVALEAKRLLVHTDAPVDEVAARVGFSESTNFVKFFRRIEGETPRRFRERFAQRG